MTRLVRSFASDRRMFLAGALVLVATPALAQVPSATPMLVWRDAGCGCCVAWSEQMRRSGRFSITVQNAPDMGAVKRRLGVPADLASCHTTEVGGFVVEGHVPLADIVRLLSAQNAVIGGIAAPGMPVGSPGMEVSSGRRDAFDVIAFHRTGSRSVFARYPALDGPN